MSVRDHWEHLHANPRYRPTYPSEAVIRWLAAHRPPVVLDLGCGAGRHAQAAIDFGCGVVGTDISAVGLAHAPCPRAVADNVRLPLRSGSVDGVIAYGSLIYGSVDQMAASLDEVYRVLRPGGGALVVIRTERDFRATGALGPGEHGPIVCCDEDRVRMLFDHFTDFELGWQDFTTGGQLNSDWVIAASR